jgi:hypothetical protein
MVLKCKSIFNINTAECVSMDLKSKNLEFKPIFITAGIRKKEVI